MTFFLDQDVPDDLAHWLRHRGHVVTCLRDVLPTTTTDAEAWQWARAHSAVLQDNAAAKMNAILSGV